jgi:hypothetical protein
MALRFFVMNLIAIPARFINSLESSAI